MSQERIAAIVGIHEYPLRDVGGLMSPLQIKAACAAKALEDAGLSWKLMLMVFTMLVTAVAP